MVPSEVSPTDGLGALIPGNWDCRAKLGSRLTPAVARSDGNRQGGASAVGFRGIPLSLCR